MTQPVLSIIVVSFNTRQMTLECLRSVIAETRTPYELIVVDNASNDGSAEAIADAFPDVLLLAESENHGFAAANNLAAERASGDYLLLLNPDTVVLDGALDRLVDFAARRPEAGIWGGRTVFADHSLNPGSCWRRMSLWSLFCSASGLSSLMRGSGTFNPEAYGGWNRDTERQVDIVSGCLFLIRRTDWQRLGGFDLRFFMYGEEADLCLRAQAKLGSAPRVTPDAVIVHHGGASEAVRSDKMVRLFAAKVELIRRHFPAWQVPPARFLFAMGPLTRALAFWLAVRVGARRDLAERARSWAEVWRRRGEWRDGYS